MKWKTAVIFSGIALLSIILYNVLNVVISTAGKNMEYENALTGLKNRLDSGGERITINHEIAGDLRKLGGWIQFVDSNGTEVWSIFKPSEIPEKLGVSNSYEVIRKLSDALNYNVISGKTHLLLKKDISDEKTDSTYYLGLPVYEGISRLSTEDVFSFFYRIDVYGVITLIIVILAAGIFGYFYSQRVLPCRNIVERAGNIGTKDYKPFEEKGIYKDVYKQINNAASRIYSQKLQSERSEILFKKRTHDIIHELKDSISTIKGYAEILSEVKGRSGESQEKEYAEIILRKSQTLDVLLEEISSINKDRE